MMNINYHVLKLIESNPEMTQRELASELDVSLGKVNYCLKAMVEKGWIKVQNFKKSNNKLAYLYLLTPKGIEQKASVTVNFLKRKITEYETLKKEIKDLKAEVESSLRAKRGR